MQVEERTWYFGPISLAPKVVLERLERAPSFRVLRARGWDPARTLVYCALNREVMVVARTFAWDAKSPAVWLISSVGICAAEQTRAPHRAVFKRFEIVVATSNAEPQSPIPARLAVVLSSDTPGWDWSQVSVPPLIEWLVDVSADLLAAVQSGSNFAICDTIDRGPVGHVEFCAQLDHGILLPATPHMLLSGYQPFDRPEAPDATVEVREWHTRPGAGDLTYGFYWLLPVTTAECGAANRLGSWNVFADLAEQSERAKRADLWAVAFDLGRAKGLSD